MRQKYVTAARQIVAHLDPAEATLGQALVDNAALIATIGRARAELNLSIGYGHDIIATLSEANGAIVAGISKTIAAHAQLGDLRDRLHLRETGTGGATYKGPTSAGLGVVHNMENADTAAA